MIHGPQKVQHPSKETHLQNRVISNYYCFIVVVVLEDPELEPCSFILQTNNTKTGHDMGVTQHATDEWQTNVGRRDGQGNSRESQWS